MTNKKLMLLALDLGEVMLRSGAETYRVEDTINRILSTSGADNIESFVTPTGIFTSADLSASDHQTYIRRIESREIHLNRLERANDLSRKFCSGELTLEETHRETSQLMNSRLYNMPVAILGISAAAGLFAIVFGGTLEDAFVAFIAGVALAVFQSGISGGRISKFFIDLMGGFITATASLIFLRFTDIGTNMDIILTSAIMPLVPGVAITNAVRDILHGHLVAGSARMLDAFIVAASIATGVGIAISIFSSLTGGVVL